MESTLDTSQVAYENAQSCDCAILLVKLLKSVPVDDVMMEVAYLLISPNREEARSKKQPDLYDSLAKPLREGVSLKNEKNEGA